MRPRTNLPHQTPNDRHLFHGWVFQLLAQQFFLGNRGINQSHALVSSLFVMQTNQVFILGRRHFLDTEYPGQYRPFLSAVLLEIKQ